MSATDDALDALELAEDLAYTAKLRAEGAHLKWQAKRERLAYRQEKLSHDWQLDGKYTLHEGIHKESVDGLLHTMSVWHRHNETAPWVITLNCRGGEEYAGYLLIDELRSHSIRCGGTHEITIKVRGVAASMGGMILQAADRRIIGRYSMLMIHKGGLVFGADESLSVDQLADEAEWQRQSVERMIDLFVSRGCPLSRTQIRRKISRKDWWISAAEAVELGLADAIA